MRTGIEIRLVGGGAVFIRYEEVEAVSHAPHGYLVCMKSGREYEFENVAAFERVKNFVTQGHPVTDYVRPPGSEDVAE